MKKITFLLLLLVFHSFARDSYVIATLEHIDSNTQLKFQYQNSLFSCKLYGIYGLDTFLVTPIVSPYCKQRVKAVLKRHPSMRYFGQNHLHIKQGYHLRFFNQECQLFSAGTKSYAEVLVEEGIAVVEPKFKNRDYYYYQLQKAQRRAKFNTRGIWEEFGMDACIQSLYKE